MIEIRALGKRYGRLDVLRGVDLSIARGRVTAIVGPNAAGKTTLIKSILGLTRPTSGRVLVDGEPVNGDSAYRARIGYMPQIARFPENLSGAELLAFLQELRGARTTERELIDRWRLSQELDKPLRTLSGGTRQKVNAVMAFLFSPELLILDEPTAGLDPLSSSILKDVILAARGEGRTFILASHIMSELEELADDVVVLLDGTVRFAGLVHDLKLETRQLTMERAIAQVMLRREAA
jgi:Cu-processing system ATP-binding protein